MQTTTKNPCLFSFTIRIPNSQETCPSRVKVFSTFLLGFFTFGSGQMLRGEKSAGFPSPCLSPLRDLDPSILGCLGLSSLRFLKAFLAPPPLTIVLCLDTCRCHQGKKEQKYWLTSLGPLSFQDLDLSCSGCFSNSLMPSNRFIFVF